MNEDDVDQNPHGNQKSYGIQTIHTQAMIQFHMNSKLSLRNTNVLNTFSQIELLLIVTLKENHSLELE